MWRYVAGGVAALAMTVAGWLIFQGQARPDGPLPSRPRPAASAATVAAATEGEPQLPAAPERTREQKRFDRYDRNRDASVAREEFLAPRRKAFAKLDANGDGRLTFDEWAVKTGQRFASADRDASGALTAAEFATTRPKPRQPRARCACPAPAAED